MSYVTQIALANERKNEKKKKCSEGASLFGDYNIYDNVYIYELG